MQSANRVTRRWGWFTLIIAVCSSCVVQSAFAGSIVGWGEEFPKYGQAMPPDGNDFVAIAAGGDHSLALKSDGSLVGWGQNSGGQAVPPDGNDFVAIAAGGRAATKMYLEGYSLALKSDGSIDQWGPAIYGLSPAGNDFVAIAAGGGYGLALKSDGSVVGWGDNDYGQATPPDGNDFVAISAGYSHSLAIRKSCQYVLAGDLNDDCKVDFSDFVLLASHWLIDCDLNPADPACVPK